MLFDQTKAVIDLSIRGNGKSHENGNCKKLSSGNVKWTIANQP